MNFYNDRKEKEIAYFTDNLDSRKGEKLLDSAPLVSQTSNIGDYQRKLSTTAFVSHYDKATGDKCFETNSSTSCGRATMKDLELLKHRSWSESTSNIVYGKGNYREGSSKSLARNCCTRSTNVVYRPSFRLWKKCSATCARTVTSVSDLYKIDEQNYSSKSDSIYAGQHPLYERKVESYDVGPMKKMADSRYFTTVTSENRSNLHSSPSLAEYSMNNNGNSVRLPYHAMGSSRFNEESMMDKSAAVSRATNAAFEAILPYITFEQAQSLRDIVTNQSPSVALSAVMQVAQNCKKTCNVAHEKDSLQKVERTLNSSRLVLGDNKSTCKSTREQDSSWLTDFSTSHSNGAEVPGSSPSASSSICSSASGAAEPLSSTNAWVSPFLLSRSLEQSGEPWDIEHCASEMEELDLLGKTLHEEAISSGDHCYNRRSRFFPVGEDVRNLDSNG